MQLQSQDVFVNVAGGARCQEPAADLGDRGGGGVELSSSGRWRRDVVVLGRGRAGRRGARGRRAGERACARRRRSGSRPGGRAPLEPGRRACGTRSTVTGVSTLEEAIGLLLDDAGRGVPRASRAAVAAEPRTSRRTRTRAAITVARVIVRDARRATVAHLLASFGAPAGGSSGSPARGSPAAGLAGVAVVALEQAAAAASRCRGCSSRRIGALGGVLLAQLVASALIVFLRPVGSPAGRGFLSLLLAYMGVVFALRREEELGGMTRLVFPGRHRRREALQGPRYQRDHRRPHRRRVPGGLPRGHAPRPEYVFRELQQIADWCGPAQAQPRAARPRRPAAPAAAARRRTELHDLDFPHIREVDRAADRDRAGGRRRHRHQRLQPEQGRGAARGAPS